MQDPIVRFVGIGKTYDGISRVVERLDLDVERGEFLTLLGPSGSGKTTTLMMLAGFETPTEGEILLEGRVVGRITSAVTGCALGYVRVEVRDDSELSIRGQPARLH